MASPLRIGYVPGMTRFVPASIDILIEGSVRAFLHTAVFCCPPLFPRRNSHPVPIRDWPFDHLITIKQS